MSTLKPDSPPFHLSLANSSDLLAIADVEYHCFGAMVRRLILGTPSPDYIPKYAALWEERQRTETHSVWIKVVDTTTGQLIAASNWGIHPNGAPAGGAALDRPIPWLEGENLKRAEKVLEAFGEVKRRQNPGGYIHLHICFTDEKYRDRGAGTMMLQWGNAVADALGLPCWVEASAVGTHLYKKAGYYEVEKIDGEVDVMGMRRDAKLLDSYGGKPTVTANLTVEEVANT